MKFMEGFVGVFNSRASGEISAVLLLVGISLYAVILIANKAVYGEWSKAPAEPKHGEACGREECEAECQSEPKCECVGTNLACSACYPYVPAG